MCTMPGWESAAAARASRSNRRMASGVCCRGLRILIATVRPRRGSRARYTAGPPPRRPAPPHVPVLLEQLGEGVERGEELTSYRQAGDRPLDDADRRRDVAFVLEPRADLHERLAPVGKRGPAR